MKGTTIMETTEETPVLAISPEGAIPPDVCKECDASLLVGAGTPLNARGYSEAMTANCSATNWKRS